MPDSLLATLAPGYHRLEGAELAAYFISVEHDIAVYENSLSAEEREKRWSEQEYWKRWRPVETARCVKCGETVLEIRYSKSHVEWQCLEETCRHHWTWRTDTRRADSVDSARQ